MVLVAMPIRSPNQVQTPNTFHSIILLMRFICIRFCCKIKIKNNSLSHLVQNVCDLSVNSQPLTAICKLEQALFGHFTLFLNLFWRRLFQVFN